MRILLSFLLLFFIGILVSSCNKEIPNEKPKITHDKNIESAESMEKRSIGYELRYQDIYNDEAYIALLKNANEGLNGLNISISKDKESIKKQLQTLIANPDFQKLSEYWNQDIFKSKTDNESKFALLNATNDLVVEINNDLDLQNNRLIKEQCQYDFGIFEVSPTILDCQSISNNYGCCYGLYCEVTNCNSNAFQEFFDDSGISWLPVYGITANAYLRYLMRDLVGGVVSVGTILLIQTTWFGFQYLDLMVDTMSCTWDQAVNTVAWSSSCNCVCPLFPACDLSYNATLGGYPIVMPNECL